MMTRGPGSSIQLLSQMDDLVARLKSHIDELKDELSEVDPKGRPKAFDRIVDTVENLGE